MNSSRFIEKRRAAFQMPYDANYISERHNAFTIELRRQRRREESKLRGPYGKMLGLNSQLSLITTDLSLEYLYALKSQLMSSALDQIVVSHQAILSILEGLHSHDEKIKEMSANVLNLIAASHVDSIENMLSTSAIKISQNCLDQNNPILSENLLILFANIAAENIAYRSLLISEGVLDTIIDFIQHNSNGNVITYGITAIKYLTKGKSLVDKKQVNRLVHLLSNYTKYEEFQEISLDTLAEVANDRYGIFSLLIDLKVIDIAFYSLQNTQSEVCLSSLRLLGNLIYRECKSAEILIERNLFDLLSELIYRGNSKIKQEVHWILSNITASYCAEKFLAHPICPKSLNSLIDIDAKIRLEASYIFRNITEKERTDFNSHLVSLNLLKYLHRASTSYKNDQLFFKNILVICNNMMKLSNSLELDSEIFSICENLTEDLNTPNSLLLDNILEDLQQMT